MCWTKFTVHNSFLTGCQIIITIAEKKLKKNWFSTGEEEVPWERWYACCRTFAAHWNDTYEGYLLGSSMPNCDNLKQTKVTILIYPRRQRF
jgi:3-methyladenine DNA glycosylase AlkD